MLYAHHQIHQFRSYILSRFIYISLILHTNIQEETHIRIIFKKKRVTSLVILSLLISSIIVLFSHYPKKNIICIYILQFPRYCFSILNITNILLLNNFNRCIQLVWSSLNCLFSGYSRHLHLDIETSKQEKVFFFN